MLGGPGIRSFLGTFYQRRKLARDVLLAVLLLCAMLALWTRQYSASAIVRLTSPNADQASAGAVATARTALTGERLAAIIKQSQLYPELVQASGEASAVRYLSSRMTLQAAGAGSKSDDEVRVTYHSSDRATVLSVANAVAQNLSQIKPATSETSAETAVAIDLQLEDSRSELKQFAAHRRGQGAGRRSRGRRNGSANLSAPTLSARYTVGQQLPSVPNSVASPESPAAQTMVQQIKALEIRLVELRERYTDQYPDVQDAQEQLQELRTRLGRLQAENASAAKASLAVPGDEHAKQAVVTQQSSQPAGARIGKKSPEPSSGARAYAFELDRYRALLRAKRNLKEYQDQGLAPARPLFTVAQSATQAKASGIAVSPLYWVFSLVASLLAATLAVFFVPRRKPAVPEKRSVRSQFEQKELAPQYRSGTR